MRADRITPTKNYDQYLFAVKPEKNEVYEYMNQPQINSFINNIDTDPVQEQISKDVTTFKFFCPDLKNQNSIENEIQKEFENLPVINRITMQRTKVEYQKRN